MRHCEIGAYLLVLLAAPGCGTRGRALQSRPSGPAGALTIEIASTLVAPGAGLDRVLDLASPFDKDGARAALLTVEPRALGRGRADVDPGGDSGDPASCQPTFSGDTADADGDGIARRATAAFDCRYTDPYAIHVTGSYEIRDADDGTAHPRAGYSLRVPRLALEATLSPTEAYTYSTEGDYALTIAATTFASTATLRRVTVAPGRTSRVRYDVDVTGAPARAAEPDAAGTLDVHGYVALDTKEAQLTIEIAGEGIAYDRACGKRPLRDGRIAFRDGAGHVLQYVLAGCALTKTLDGIPLP